LFDNTLSGRVPAELCSLVETNGLELRIASTATWWRIATSVVVVAA